MARELQYGFTRIVVVRSIITDSRRAPPPAREVVAIFGSCMLMMRAEDGVGLRELATNTSNVRNLDIDKVGAVMVNGGSSSLEESRGEGSIWESAQMGRQ